MKPYIVHFSPTRADQARDDSQAAITIASTLLSIIIMVSLCGALTSGLAYRLFLWAAGL